MTDDVTYAPGAITVDLVANTSYLYVRPDTQVARTIEIAPDLMVDVDADGRVVGVESLSGAVGTSHLARVVMRLRFDREAIDG